MSAFGSRNLIEVISCFPANDLPLPDTPKMNEFPFKSCLLSAIIIFLLIAF